MAFVASESGKNDTTCMKYGESRRTLHVEGLQDEELVVAGLVEECGEPGLVPDARVRVPVLELVVTRDHRHPRQRPQPRLHLRPRRLRQIRPCGSVMCMSTISHLHASGWGERQIAAPRACIGNNGDRVKHEWIKKQASITPSVLAKKKPLILLQGSGTGHTSPVMALSRHSDTAQRPCSCRSCSSKYALAFLFDDLA